MQSMRRSMVNINTAPATPPMQRLVGGGDQPVSLSLSLFIPHHHHTFSTIACTVHAPPFVPPAAVHMRNNFYSKKKKTFVAFLVSEHAHNVHNRFRFDFPTGNICGTVGRPVDCGYGATWWSPPSFLGALVHLYCIGA